MSTINAQYSLNRLGLKKKQLYSFFNIKSEDFNIFLFYSCLANNLCLRKLFAPSTVESEVCIDENVWVVWTFKCSRWCKCQTHTDAYWKRGENYITELLVRLFLVGSLCYVLPIWGCTLHCFLFSTIPLYIRMIIVLYLLLFFGWKNVRMHLSWLAREPVPIHDVSMWVCSIEEGVGGNKSAAIFIPWIGLISKVSIDAPVLNYY